MTRTEVATVALMFFALMWFADRVVAGVAS